MAVTYASGTKNNRLKMVFLAGAVTPAAGESVDSGAGVGTLVIGTSALAGGNGTEKLSQISLQKPSVSIAGGVATLLGVPLTQASALNTGTAAKAEVRDSVGNVVISGLTVGTSGSDINLSTTSITAGSPVTITSGTITHG